MTIYRSKQGKEKILSLYDSQIKEFIRDEINEIVKEEFKNAIK